MPRRRFIGSLLAGDALTSLPLQSEGVRDKQMLIGQTFIDKHLIDRG